MKEFLLIPEARDEIFLYLIKENYLNEERFTRSYIRGKFYIKHWGRNKIRMNLKQKGITDKLISNCMDEIDGNDYEKTLKKIYRDYFSKQKEQKEYQKKTKAIRHLMSKGFEYDVILDILDNG